MAATAATVMVVNIHIKVMAMGPDMEAMEDMEDTVQVVTTCNHGGQTMLRICNSTQVK